MADHAILETYRRGVIGLHRVEDVLTAYDKPPHDWGDKTAWPLFNAATFALNGTVTANLNATARLHQVIDSTCSVIL